jgi:3-phenylpropionate/trans-cinnamate dioxygenase ferredoxin subunit
MKWYKVAESKAELFQNNLASVMVNGKHICFAMHQDALFAFTDKCPHAGGKLSSGYVDAMGNVVCPLHRYKFTMKNGYNCSGEGYFLKTYPVKEDDGIWVQV